MKLLRRLAALESRIDQLRRDCVEVSDGKQDIALTLMDIELKNAHILRKVSLLDRNVHASLRRKVKLTVTIPQIMRQRFLMRPTITLVVKRSLSRHWRTTGCHWLLQSKSNMNCLLLETRHRKQYTILEMQFIYVQGKRQTPIIYFLCTKPLWAYQYHQ